MNVSCYQREKEENVPNQKFKLSLKVKISPQFITISIYKYLLNVQDLIKTIHPKSQIKGINTSICSHSDVFSTQAPWD